MDERHPPSVVEDVPPPSRNARGVEPQPSRRWWLWLLLMVLLGVGLYFLWPKRSDTKSDAAASRVAGARGRGAMITPVVATRILKGDIGVYFTGLGAVTPLYTVTVKSRVDGQLMRVHYLEGDVVHQGDLLAEIDPRPFEVQLSQAEGQLLKDEAALNNARIDLERYQTLLTHNAVPEQQLATQKATVLQDQGAVKSDQGLIDSARLSLAYCRITAPITGRAGLRLVDPGNIVHASDANGLMVITQVQPISVIFTIAEDQVPVVFKRVRGGQRLRVDAYDRDMKTKIAQGSLTTLDNQIDQTTGTLKLRATFDNRDGALFPNQFVNARLLVEEKHGATLVSTAAVQRNSQTTYVYLVKPDSTVTVRPISTGTAEGNETEVVSGLSPGDVAVMTGVDRLQEGSKVSPHIEGENAGPAASGRGAVGSRPAGSAGSARAPAGRGVQ
jgi:multidrug efflux system membrane fusion protein